MTQRPEATVGFKRSFVLPAVVLTALEALVVVYPVFPLFQLTTDQRNVLARAAVPIFVGAELVWLAALGSWFMPVQRMISLTRRGERPSAEIHAAGWRALSRVAMRALWLRAALWLATALGMGWLLTRYTAFSPPEVVSFVSIVGLHAFFVEVLRGAWYSRLASRLRTALYRDVEPLQELADGWSRRVLLVALVVGAGGAAALAAFVYYFLPLKQDEYLQVMSLLPGGIALATLAWFLYARRLRRPIALYLADKNPDEKRATIAYQQAQSLPYRLAGAKVALWIVAAALVSWGSRRIFQIEADNATLMFGAAVVIFIGAGLYEAIWHRETMRPLLIRLSVRHRLPVRELRAPLSLRAKLLISFGGLVLFSCGLSLFWAFIQYKALVTRFVTEQAKIKLDWVRSEVQGRAGQASAEPSDDLLQQVLDDAGQTATENEVFYRVPDTATLASGFGGGPMGAPRLPWYTTAMIRTHRGGSLEVGSLGLSGNFTPVDVMWNGKTVHLGSVAVLYPGYRGRGTGIQRPVKELLLFFLVLFGVCAGIVLLTVQEFVRPIRLLEQRADEMARGELTRSVSSVGEGDEVGRLTFALEEMRRALRDKLRSTEEVNLDLEREVQRRTADLAKKNRELADALEKLTRAQRQLVRAEKMASIGQLVAGIAHEINNPVNAIANTVGPLKETVEELTAKTPDAAEAASELGDMIRVIQNGARRTKEIVQALHNYSRTDDERLVELDVNRGLDDSLELLRHHLKGGVEVVRKYGDCGRIKGHAGQLNQVFMNLLTNAAQALSGRDGAKIELVTERKNGLVVIQVIDNGPGIPTEIVPKIFDPFFTTKEVGQGTGLGLSIVHGIVERHGGTIEVDSHLGVGTTFTVTLPITIPQASA